ncbi:---NA--- [Paramuricea clavata]|uniref:---NA n=1 Tax=Paramuricea clavata TaxID=317549 RepID=A0A6S7I331_PARCT|nr:---NA--- [Paramuricea clavata]
MKCYIFCLAIIPMVLCSVPALDHASKTMNCPDCKIFPSENSNYTDFTVILQKKNTPTFFVGIRDGVLQITMDGNLIHNISIPSKENDHKTCMYSVKQGIHKECGNIIGEIIPQKNTDLMLACGNNADQTEQCWKINETNVVGKPDSYSFYSKNPERKYVISGIQTNALLHRLQ